MQKYIINVVNKRKHKSTPNDFYAGRPSVLGNPYSHIPKGTLAKYVVKSREESISKHREDFYNRIETDKSLKGEVSKLVNHLKENGEINLICFCAPLSCHCDTIKEYLLNILIKPNFENKITQCKHCDDTGWINSLERCICVRKWDYGM